ncbi:MAG: serine/threonine-protein kinase, partial [Candidatus Eremiobacterota bacterium]
GLALGAAFGVVWRRRRSARLAEERARKITDLIVPSGEDDPMLGGSLEGHRVVERLGKGGMATVYRGVPDASLDDSQAVAIKILDPELARDPDFVRRFDRETSVYYQLTHPNIVRVLGHGCFQGRYYLIMELVRGSTLRECVRPEGMTPAEALKLVRPVMLALEFAHRKGIVHRDVKPENVMLTEAGQVKVMDFGMARGKQYATVTATGALLGTPAYMAPEQIQGKLDPRSDQYSVGVMLYEMLAGTPPFMDDNPVTILMSHLSQPPPPLTERRPGLEATAPVVHRMLAKNPEDRYPDLAAAVAELERST